MAFIAPALPRTASRTIRVAASARGSTPPLTTAGSDFHGFGAASLRPSTPLPVAAPASALKTNPSSARSSRAQPRRLPHSRAVVSMGNVNAGRGLFAPLVVAAKSAIGPKRFNRMRGKAIALHLQVIAGFCSGVGLDSAQRQGLIRLAKRNGERLGFLA